MASENYPERPMLRPDAEAPGRGASGGFGLAVFILIGAYRIGACPICAYPTVYSYGMAATSSPASCP